MDLKNEQVLAQTNEQLVKYVLKIIAQFMVDKLLDEGEIAASDMEDHKDDQDQYNFCKGRKTAYDEMIGAVTSFMGQIGVSM